MPQLFSAVMKRFALTKKTNHSIVTMYTVKNAYGVHLYYNINLDIERGRITVSSVVHDIFWPVALLLRGSAKMDQILAVMEQMRIHLL